MSDQEQTDAMAAILGKMNAATQTGSHTATANTASENDAMADVLRRLNEATAGAAYDVVTESQTNQELDMALKTERTVQGVSIARYEIQTEKKTVQEGLKKTFYYIVDNKTGDIVHEDLGLFESAMGIVKHMLYTKDENRINRIINLDTEYVSAMVETYSHKKRLQRLDEGVQHDVVSAKYTKSREKVSSVKLRLLKAL